MIALKNAIWDETLDAIFEDSYVKNNLSQAIPCPANDSSLGQYHQYSYRAFSAFCSASSKYISFRLSFGLEAGDMYWDVSFLLKEQVGIPSSKKDLENDPMQIWSPSILIPTFTDNLWSKTTEVAVGYIKICLKNKMYMYIL